MRLTTVNCGFNARCTKFRFADGHTRHQKVTERKQPLIQEKRREEGNGVQEDDSAAAARRVTPLLER